MKSGKEIQFTLSQDNIEPISEEVKSLLLFPWDRGEEPFYTNEEGFDWFIDQSTTDYANRSAMGSQKPLNATCFYVVKNNKPITRVLINNKTNEILAEHQDLDGMGCKIDMLRII